MNRSLSYVGIIICVNSVLSYRAYQNLIPNGDKVPHPCNKRQTWEGVGHRQNEGGDEQNPFGIDFQQFGEWNKKLCLLDSDGDGRYNGEELGDPDCTWKTQYDNVHLCTTNLSHPGICEPLDSSLCRERAWLSCEASIDDCPSLKEKDTRNITVKMPKRKVPRQTTTYTCLLFEFPQDQDYHIVATKPVIDNKHVMHHILLFGCDESVEDITEDMNEPFTCGMIASPKCSSVIGIWSMGMSGECSHNSSGFRIGKNGFRKGALQIHWNNPDLYDGMTDASGMTIFYTHVLRQYDAGIMIVGQYWIDLQPKKKRVVVTGECSPECSDKLIEDEIYITSGYNHMHYLGRQERIELYRKDRKIKDLAYDQNFNYDMPVLHSYQEPVKLKPGDEIKVTCIYSTTSRSENVHFGYSTSDEMCLGFLTYFPKENLKDPYCTNWKSISRCLLWKEDVDTDVQGCYIQRLLQGQDVTANQIIQNIMQACAPFETCSDWCRFSLNSARQHPCFQGDVLDFIGFETIHDLPKFLIPFILCDFKRDMNFSTEVIFKKQQTFVPVNQHNLSICHSKRSHISLFLLQVIFFILIS
ncbi:tyramine beta-hydroxylase-like [Mytilus edulis]|uniref:tyramine beta-hydroxylase-like n=1 Tax=Mytilus edulis TaxID=6550 RepID=UPI0039EFBEE5